MSPNGQYLSFPTIGELLHYLEKHTGTIARALIPQSPPLDAARPGEPQIPVENAGLVLEWASGETAYLKSEDAEAILNDGILNRQHVEITFMG
jgi:hypothetical protein